MKARMIVLFGAVAALAACGPPTFKATLSGGAEVPALTGIAGTGSVTVTVDGMNVDVTGTYSGLTGAAQSAHLHGPGTAAETKPNVCTLTVTEGTPAGSGTLAGECLAFDIAGLNSGMYYANIHTTAHAGGEIRGQLAKQ
ncbi:MAG TPA: CHRD domain-containing protein [Myxococcaceae bacterium]|jgi:hypothetical protein